MKEEEKIGLSEAIKRHYRTEPLKTQLPMAVAGRVFGKKTSLAADAWLYVLAAVCGLGILAVCLSYFPQVFFSSSLLWFWLPLGTYFWLSLKEIKVWSTRVKGLEQRT